MAKELRKICTGPVHAKDKRWFTDYPTRLCMFLLEIFIYYQLNISPFSKMHQSAPVLVHEKPWWQP